MRKPRKAPRAQARPGQVQQEEDRVLRAMYEHTQVCVSCPGVVGHTPPLATDFGGVGAVSRFAGARVRVGIERTSTGRVQWGPTTYRRGDKIIRWRRFDQAGPVLSILQARLQRLKDERLLSPADGVALWSHSSQGFYLGFHVDESWGTAAASSFMAWEERLRAPDGTPPGFVHELLNPDRDTRRDEVPISSLQFAELLALSRELAMAIHGHKDYANGELIVGSLVGTRFLPTVLYGDLPTSGAIKPGRFWAGSLSSLDPRLAHVTWPFDLAILHQVHHRNEDSRGWYLKYDKEAGRHFADMREAARRLAWAVNQQQGEQASEVTGRLEQLRAELDDLARAPGAAQPEPGSAPPATPGETGAQYGFPTGLADLLVKTHSLAVLEALRESFGSGMLTRECVELDALHDRVCELVGLRHGERHQELRHELLAQLARLETSAVSCRSLGLNDGALLLMGPTGSLEHLDEALPAVRKRFPDVFVMYRSWLDGYGDEPARIELAPGVPHGPEARQFLAEQLYQLTEWESHVSSPSPLPWHDWVGRRGSYDVVIDLNETTITTRTTTQPAKRQYVELLAKLAESGGTLAYDLARQYADYTRARDFVRYIGGQIGRLTENSVVLELGRQDGREVIVWDKGESARVAVLRR
jgi:hypothetical protein